MHVKRLITTLALVAVLPLVAGIAVASNGNSETDVVKSATTRFHNVGLAKAAGYAKLVDAKKIACIEAAKGGMGVHYVNGKFVGDAVLTPKRPEALVYAPGANGKLSLAAVEYIVFEKAWKAKHLQPPSLFGRRFDFTPAGNRYGIPAFYSLHAWIFKQNSAGLLQPYNPAVNC